MPIMPSSRRLLPAAAVLLILIQLLIHGSNCALKSVVDQKILSSAEIKMQIEAHYAVLGKECNYFDTLNLTGKFWTAFFKLPKTTEKLNVDLLEMAGINSTDEAKLASICFTGGLMECQLKPLPTPTPRPPIIPTKDTVGTCECMQSPILTENGTDPYRSCYIKAGHRCFADKDSEVVDAVFNDMQFLCEKGSICDGGTMKCLPKRGIRGKGAGAGQLILGKLCVLWMLISVFGVKIWLDS